MGRILKPVLIDEFTSRSGVRVKIEMNRNNNRFECKLFSWTLSNPSLDGLRVEITDKLKAAEAPQWVDVIQVAETKPFVANEDAYFGFVYERFHVWQRPDNKIMTVRWGTEEEHRLDRSHESWEARTPGLLVLPHRFNNNLNREKSTWLAYDESLWLALGLMQDKLLDLKQAFRALLATPEGVARLTSWGEKRLLAGGRSHVEHARAIKREAPERGYKGDCEVAAYEDGYIVDHDPLEGDLRKSRRAIKRIWVAPMDGMYHGRYSFDEIKGKELEGVAVTYIVDESPVQALGGLTESPEE